MLRRISKRFYAKSKYCFQDHLNGEVIAENLLISRRGDLVILVYHGVTKYSIKLNGKFVTFKRFKDDIELLSTYCHFVSWSDVKSNKIASDKMNVLLTFDDGYLNNYKYVVPLLKERRIPAVFCATAIKSTPYEILWPDLLDLLAFTFKREIKLGQMEFTLRSKYPWGKKQYESIEGVKLSTILKKGGHVVISEFSNDKLELIDKVVLTRMSEFWELMNADQLLEIDSNELFEVVPHGVFHCNLTMTNGQDVKKEMRQSKVYFDKLLKRKVDTFCFPEGAYNDQLLDLGKFTGYDYFLLTDPIPNTSIFDHCMSRMTIHPFISAKSQIIAIHKGYYYEQ